MKIKDNHLNEILEVYATYWREGETFFIVKYEYDEGFSILSGSNIEVVDPYLGDDFLYYNSGFYYRPLLEGTLFADLLEHKVKAYKRFVEILKITRGDADQ